MAKVALVKIADDSVVKIVDRDKTFGGKAPPDISHKGLKWLDYTDAPQPSFNAATHKIDGPPTEVVSANAVTKTWNVASLSQGEIDALAVAEDERTVTRSLLALAEITIIHIDAHLAKGNIAAADFNAATRKKYQDLKKAVDRLRNA